MFKVEAKLNKKQEAENILFETAPSNWMLSLNRKTKDLKLEGVFEVKLKQIKEYYSLKSFYLKTIIK